MSFSSSPFSLEGITYSYFTTKVFIFSHIFIIACGFLIIGCILLFRFTFTFITIGFVFCVFVFNYIIIFACILITICGTFAFTIEACISIQLDKVFFSSSPREACLQFSNLLFGHIILFIVIRIVLYWDIVLL